MKRITIRLPESLAAALKREARRNGVPVSRVIREAIEARLGLSAGSDRKLPFAALGRSGHRSTARDLEDSLEREWAIERPPDSVVERTAGAFKGYGPTLTAEELREASEKAIADDVVDRSGD